MKRARFTEELITGILREHEAGYIWGHFVSRLSAPGPSTVIPAAICTPFPSCHRSLTQYSGLFAAECPDLDDLAAGVGPKDRT